ncbi:uncharacterized protein ALTATR162_LOCUS4302 [Alternaria atra]|uniref:Uncharacterized protein n=1 Tax=Alternaria atra TaxID=119953 RepID=A0A8J2N4W4_9PLEO|nr:uncharacterized protein ALTATR162_LOCUS4302 [Alternaria atra]CAG5156505.1 unnamed protein product [Alternaria atra]
MPNIPKQNASHDPPEDPFGSVVDTGTCGPVELENHTLYFSTENNQNEFLLDAVESAASHDSDTKHIFGAEAAIFMPTEKEKEILMAPYTLVTYPPKRGHGQGERKQDQVAHSNTQYLPDSHRDMWLACSCDDVEPPASSSGEGNEDSNMSSTSSHTLGRSDRSSSTLAAEEEDPPYEEMVGCDEDKINLDSAERDSDSGYEGNDESEESGSEMSSHTLGQSEGSSRTLGRSEDGDSETDKDDDEDEEMQDEEEGDLFAQSYREGSRK